MTYLQLVLNPGQLSLQNLLLLLSVHLVQSDDGLGLEILTIQRSVQSSPGLLTHHQLLLRLLSLEVTESLGQRGVHIRPPVESAQLHHVVHQVDDGVHPGQLLLQLPGVLPQVQAGLVAQVPHVVLLCLAGVNGLQQAGGLSP